MSTQASELFLLSLLPTPEQEFSDDYDDLIFVGAYDIQIESHVRNTKTCDVSFRIKFKFSPADAWCRGWAEEIDLQKYYQDIVLNYWRGIGGRCKATRFKTYKVLRILAEEKNRYRVQWVGYDEEDTSWETKKKAMDICPKAVLAWKTRLVG
ncbi:hypothetical protein FBEOM_11553 [Fusarium beomiforme]|uniref:Chromo domain-containing protein n=1 Tax=Fusarium beomiforme TaxID=44412 RepID=A0A9P5A9E9_9HYPO|nr:hypothetical protein FBEOM_11553 [Fusarium beomiforme]